MNGKGRIQCGGRVPTNDYRDGRSDGARIGSNSEDSFDMASEGLVEQLSWSSTTLHPERGKVNLIGLVAKGRPWRQHRRK